MLPTFIVAPALTAWLGTTVSGVDPSQVHLTPPTYYCIRFQLYIELNSNWLLLRTILFLLNNRHSKLSGNLLHFFNISRKNRSSVSKLLFVPKTKLNFGKCTYFVAAPIIWNQISITIKSAEIIFTVFETSTHACLKILFHQNCLVPCSSDDLCLSSPDHRF